MSAPIIKWRSVKDEPPPHFRQVLVAVTLPGGRRVLDFGRLYVDEWRLEGWLKGEPTHWSFLQGEDE